MSLYTQFIFQIGLMMIWLSIFGLDMYDDLLDLQVVQCYKRSILIGCIYDLDTGCLCPLIFHYWCIFRLVAWIWVVYDLSHTIFWFHLHVEGMRCCYQVQSWWRIVVDYFMLRGWTYWELDAQFKDVIMVPWILPWHDWI